MKSVARYPVHTHYGYQQATLHAVDSVNLINLINTSEVTDLASSQTTTENSVPRILAIKDSRNTEGVMCVMSVSIPHLYTIRVPGSLPAHAALLSERN